MPSHGAVCLCSLWRCSLFKHSNLNWRQGRYPQRIFIEGVVACFIQPDPPGKHRSFCACSNYIFHEMRKYLHWTCTKTCNVCYAELVLPIGLVGTASGRTSIRWWPGADCTNDSSCLRWPQNSTHQSSIRLWQIRSCQSAQHIGGKIIETSIKLVVWLKISVQWSKSKLNTKLIREYRPSKRGSFDEFQWSAKPLAQTIWRKQLELRANYLAPKIFTIKLK